MTISASGVLVTIIVLEYRPTKLERKLLFIVTLSFVLGLLSMLARLCLPELNIAMQARNTVSGSARINDRVEYKSTLV